MVTTHFLLYYYQKKNGKSLFSERIIFKKIVHTDLPFRFCKLTRVCNKNHHCTEFSENTSGNLVSNTVRACLIRVVIPWQCVIVSIYWAFSATPHSFLSQEELCWLPRVCYLTTFLSIIALCYKPLSVYVQPTQSEAPLVYGISTAYTSPFLTLQVTPFILFWNF